MSVGILRRRNGLIFSSEGRGEGQYVLIILTADGVNLVMKAVLFNFDSFLDINS